MLGGTIDATIGKVVGQLLSEASRQFHEHTAMIKKGAAAMKAGRRAAGMCLFDEAGDRLKNVRILAEDVRQWGFDDSTGIIAMQADTIMNVLAASEAEFHRTVEDLNQQYVRQRADMRPLSGNIASG